jgi:hypothetical protein
MHAMAHHIGFATTATIETGDRAKTYFRGWNGRKFLAAVFAVFCNTPGSEMSASAFGATALTSNWPPALKSHTTMGTFC